MPRYKYSKDRAFRTEKPKLVKGTKGWVWIQGCDEFVGGRWEGFSSQRSSYFKTKAEALKHKPKW